MHLAIIFLIAQMLPFPTSGISSGGGGPATLIAGSNACYGFANGGSSASLTATGATFYVACVGWYPFGATPTASINVAGQGAESMTALTTYGPAGSFRTTMFYLSPAHTGSTYVENVTGSGSFPGFCTRAYSGTPSSAVFQAGTDNGSASGCAQPCSPGNDGTPSGKTLVISCNASFPGDTGTYSIGSGFTNLNQIQPVGGTNIGAGIADLYQSIGAAVNPTWSMAAGSTIAPAIAAFKGL